MALSASGVPSVNTLRVRNGITYSHRLYTSSTDAPSPRIVVRVNGQNRYAGLCNYVTTPGVVGSAPLKLRAAGTKVVMPITYSHGAIASTNLSSNQTLYFDVDTNERFIFSVPTSKQIRVYTGTTGAQVATWTLAYTPADIVVDSSNYVYVRDQNNSYVIKYNSSGTSQGSIYNTAFITPVFANGHIYATHSSDPKIRKYNTSLTTISTSAVMSGLYKNFGVDSSDNVYYTNTSKTFKYSWSGALAAENPQDPNITSGVCFVPEVSQAILDNYQSGAVPTLKNHAMGGVGFMKPPSVNADIIGFRARNGKVYCAYGEGGLVKFAIYTY